VAARGWRGHGVTTAPARQPWRQALLFLLVCLGGFLGNWFRFQLFLNVDFLFGSLFVLVAMARLGLPVALAAGVVSASCTYLIWNHPWAIVILGSEVLFVGLGSRRRPGQLLLLDILFWMGLGLPLVLVFYHGVMGMGWQPTFMVALKQALNGIFNAMLATLVLYFLDLLRRRRGGHGIPMGEFSFAVMAAACMLPAFAYLVHNVRGQARDMEKNMEVNLRSSADNAQELLNRWLDRDLGAVQALAGQVGDPQRTPFLAMQRDADTFRLANPDLIRAGIINAQGRSACFSPSVDTLGRSTVGVDFSDRPYVPALRSTLKPVFPEVVMGRFGRPAPILPLVAPIVIGGAYRGYCVGVVDFENLAQSFHGLFRHRQHILTIFDQRGRVVLSTAPQRPPMQVWARPPGEERQLASGVRQWIPLSSRNTSIMQRWNQSSFLVSLPLAPDRPWTLVVETSAGPAVARLTQVVFQQLLVLAVVLMVSLPIALLLALILGRSLGALEEATREIPRLLAAGEAPRWPHSRVREMQSLIANFQEMTSALGESFQALTRLNRTLEQRVDARTHELHSVNQRLAAKQRQLEELNQSLELRIQEAVTELRKKDQVMIAQSRHAAMGEMIGNIAHQWRQPLNALNLVLFNLKEAFQAGELDARAMGEAAADGNRLIQRMSATISDFRDFFKVDKVERAFSAPEHVRETISLVEASFRKDQVLIRVEGTPALQVLGFPNEYAHVLLNLLSNAREAILASGEGGLVTVRVGLEAGEGFLQVTDTGGGIPAEVMDNIYDPYFSTKPKGTGVGLYMSRMIVERSLHGRIEARNVEGGAQFTVFTPLPPGAERS
jgi:C4-dicarboxylate-specific signal transduction histidine kinase